MNSELRLMKSQNLGRFVTSITANLANVSTAFNLLTVTGLVNLLKVYNQLMLHQATPQLVPGKLSISS